MLSVQMSFRWISRDGVLPKTRGLFWSYLFWGSAKWHLNLLVQNILNWLVNWFLNLLVRNVIEREIEREKVQTKSPRVQLRWILEHFEKKNLNFKDSSQELDDIQISRIDQLRCQKGRIRFLWPVKLTYFVDCPFGTRGSCLIIKIFFSSLICTWFLLF